MTLVNSFRDELLNDTIPFWFPRAVDIEHGGFLHCFDRDGTIVDTDKSVWAQGRMTWMLMTLYNTVEQQDEWLQWSRSALEFLHLKCIDSDERMFFHVTRDGKPIRKRRYAYSESFASIACAAYAHATGDDFYFTRAMDLFENFTLWHFTPGLMPPKTTDTRPTIDIGSRMITINTARELINSLGNDAKLFEWIDRCIEEIRQFFIKEDIQCVMETVGPNGEILDHFDGRLLNPGHAIECAWFIMNEGRLRQEQELVQLGCKMLDWMWKRGRDDEHGGIFYFRDVYDRPVQEYWQDMKFWWVHDEAIIATCLAYNLTGDEKYSKMHEQVHNWSYCNFADPEQGEWYGYLHRDGRISTTLKGNLWKSFFHHPRMLWFCSTFQKETT